MYTLIGWYIILENGSLAPPVRSVVAHSRGCATGEGLLQGWCALVLLPCFPLFLPLASSILRRCPSVFCILSASPPSESLQLLSGTTATSVDASENVTYRKRHTLQVCSAASECVTLLPSPVQHRYLRINEYLYLHGHSSTCFHLLHLQLSHLLKVSHVETPDKP